MKNPIPIITTCRIVAGLLAVATFACVSATATRSGGPIELKKEAKKRRVSNWGKRSFAMLRSLKVYAGLAGLSVAMFLAGCQTTPQPASRSALVQTPEGLLTCRDCKVAGVQDPVYDPKGRLVGYRSRKAMECPDCKDVDESMGEGDFLTRHTCSTCGDSIVICSMHKAARPSTNK